MFIRNKFMKIRSFKNLAITMLGSAAFLGVLVPSSYATLTYQSSFISNGGAAVNAMAFINISGSTMSVTLIDLQANPGSVANILNGIQINISGVTGVSGLTADSAKTADIDSNGNYNPTTTAGSIIASPSGWTVGGSSTITLSALGTGNPQFLIIGPDANNNFTDGSGNPGYTAAHGSIAGNGPHNPFILGQETFYFNLSGSGYSESTIQGITFLFGTGCDYAEVIPVPEPSTIVAGALLLLPLGISAFRILRKDRTVSMRAK